MLKLLWKREISQSKDLQIWLLPRPLANLLLTASGMEMILEIYAMGALWWVREENAPKMPIAKTTPATEIGSKIAMFCKY